MTDERNTTHSRLEAAKQLRNFKDVYLRNGSLHLVDAEWVNGSWRGGKILHVIDEDENYPEEQPEQKTPISWKRALQLICTNYMRFPEVFINAYEVVQCYGGPEEGGWWYDLGTPLASMPVVDRGNNVDRIMGLLEERFGEEYDSLPARSSARGDGADLVICVQGHFAKEYPEERPYYC